MFTIFVFGIALGAGMFVGAVSVLTLSTAAEMAIKAAWGNLVKAKA